jgi:hypothetical protein
MASTRRWKETGRFRPWPAKRKRCRRASRSDDGYARADARRRAPRRGA